MRRVPRTARLPFIGDYLGTTPVVQFVFDPLANLWKWALTAADVPFQGFRAVFADSRNQGPPDGATPANPMIDVYGNFAPPGFVAPSELRQLAHAQSRRHARAGRCLRGGERDRDLQTARKRRPSGRSR